MRVFSFDDEQTAWLTTIVRYRLEDETHEKQEKLSSGYLKDMDLVEHRIEVWKSIYLELTKSPI